MKNNAISQPAYNEDKKASTGTIIRGTSNQYGLTGISGQGSSFSDRTLPSPLMMKPPTEHKGPQLSDSPNKSSMEAKHSSPTYVRIHDNLDPRQLQANHGVISASAGGPLSALLLRPLGDGSALKLPLRRSSDALAWADKTQAVDNRDKGLASVVLSSTQNQPFKFKKEDEFSLNNRPLQNTTDQGLNDNSIYRPNIANADRENEGRRVHGITASIVDRSKSQSFGKRDLFSSSKGNLYMNQEGEKNFTVNDRPNNFNPGLKPTYIENQDSSSNILNNSGYNLGGVQGPVLTLGSSFKPTYVTANGEPPKRTVDSSTTPLAQHPSILTNQPPVSSQSPISAPQTTPVPSSDPNRITIIATKSVAKFSELKGAFPPKSDTSSGYAGSASLMNNPYMNFTEPTQNLPETGSSPTPGPFISTPNSTMTSPTPHYSGSTGTRTVNSTLSNPAASYGFTTSNTGGSNPPANRTAFAQNTHVSTNTQKTNSSFTEPKPSPLMASLAGGFAANSQSRTIPSQNPTQQGAFSGADRKNPPASEGMTTGMITIKSQKEGGTGYPKSDQSTKRN